MKPVVLAGGSGSRLWPKSRAALPKQFLSLTSDSTMLQDTITRLKGTPAQNPIFICNILDVWVLGPRPDNYIFSE